MSEYRTSRQPFAWYWHDEDGFLFIEVIKTENTPTDAKPLYETNWLSAESEQEVESPQ